MSVVVDELDQVEGESKHLGEFVRRVRDSRHLRQDELARRAGLAAPDVSAMENGRKFVFRPSMPLLERLADGLAQDPRDRARLMRHMLVLAGMKRETLEALASFSWAMSPVAS